MNSPFMKHKIDHLSASALNEWMSDPFLCCLKRLIGFRDETSAAMARGNAVEAGMAQMLHGMSLDQALDAAINTFWQNMMGEASEDSVAESELIKPMIHRLYEWNPKPKLLASQMKIEWWFEKVSVPVIGYVDFTFDDDYPLLDLKTTKRIPSEPRPDHVRQVSLYMKARREKGSLLYVSDKRVAQYEVTKDMADNAMNELEAAAVSLERFLSRFDSAEDAIRCLPVNMDSYRFSKEARMKVMEMRL